MKKLSLHAPETPGAQVTFIGTYEDFPAAREAAARKFGHRKDLRRQDVVIRLGEEGKIIEYCGPDR